MLLNGQPSKPIPKNKKQVQITSPKILPTISPGADSTDWEDSGVSNRSVYKRPSSTVHSTSSTSDAGIEEDNIAESGAIDGRDVHLNIQRSSRRLRSSD